MSFIHYKVYVPVAGEEFEIRRLAVENHVRTSYEYLKNKIFAYFPALKDHNFNLYWKDLEGDNIRISTDAELIIALNENIHQLYKKIYVTTMQQPDTADEVSEASTADIANITNNLNHNLEIAEESEIRNTDIPDVKKPIHLTVTCDNCGQNPLQGHRYKCLVCFDYDLCSNCEKSQNIHTEHPMIRIALPATRECSLGQRFSNVKTSMLQNLKCLLQS